MGLSAPAELPDRPLLVALAGFSAFSALAGAVQLLASAGSDWAPPASLLAHTPFGSFLVPGLLLGGAVGGTSLACAVLAWRRSRWAVDAALLAGGALVVWIVAEVALIEEWSFLQAVYLALGAAILRLGARAAWRSGDARLRWLVAVGAAETMGFFALGVALLAWPQALLGDRGQLALLSAAGFVEGAVLGLGQALALPLPVRRGRFALLTALAVGLAWTALLAAARLALASPGLPAALALAAVGAGGLLAIGVLPWLELRRHGARAGAWIGWTVVAWALALPLSLAHAPLLDASTPAAANLALWNCSGAVKAYALALITWQAVRRLPGAAPGR